MTRSSVAKEELNKSDDPVVPPSKKQKIDLVPEPVEPPPQPQPEPQPEQEVVVFRERSDSLSPDEGVVTNDKYTCEDGSSDIRILSSE